ncbi:MAG: phosphate regulon sensor histidine kinase PhoR [Gammaproteobacteria bacterium]|nr:phosphate regulon sensor histidine kinase PhoR [Gammaproteobacteria bacterium]
MLLFFVLAILLGWLVSGVGLFLFLYLAAYLIWHLLNIYRLERWYHQRKEIYPPQGSGIWESVFHQIYLLQQRNRRRKKKLASILSRFNKSTSALPDATVVLNASGHIEWFNKSARRYLGLKANKDVGQRIENLIRNPRFVDFMQAGDFTDPMEMLSPVNNEQFLSIRVVHYGSNQRLLVVRDITRIHHLERVRQDFVANVSHELRTPLTVISGYLENIIDAEDDSSLKWNSILLQMHSQAQRMNTIVEDLLLLSRLESSEVVKTDAVINVSVMIYALCEENALLHDNSTHNLHLELDDSLLLKGDEKVFYSIFANLIFNALHYTPEGGRIDIRWSRKGKGAFFEVTDSGVGIGVQHLSRLTERFYRVDSDRSRDSGGTGLGLSIVKHGLDCYGGRLDIESRLGQGSTFRAWLPAKILAG